MAIRQEELVGLDAVVYRFPTESFRARAARRSMMARRRRSLGVATVLVAASLLLGGRPLGAAETSRTPQVAPHTVTVRPGDSLWGLAERYAPASGDPRAYIDAAVALNGLEGPIEAGMRLRLP